MLHPARRLWKRQRVRPGRSGRRGVPAVDARAAAVRRAAGGRRAGSEIPGRFFQFLRSGDPRPLEPVLEHNRLDLVSLAAVTARAVRLAEDGRCGVPRRCGGARARPRLRARRGPGARGQLLPRGPRYRRWPRCGRKRSTGWACATAGSAVREGRRASGGNCSRWWSHAAATAGAGCESAAAVRRRGAGDPPGAPRPRLCRGARAGDVRARRSRRRRRPRAGTGCATGWRGWNGSSRNAGTPGLFPADQRLAVTWRRPDLLGFRGLRGLLPGSRMSVRRSAS